MNLCPTQENASENISKIFNPKKTFEEDYKEKQNKLLDEVFKDE